MNRKYTEEQKVFIRCNHLGVDSKELTIRINNQFGQNFTVGQITSLRYELGCASGITNHGKRVSPSTEFKKGHQTWNKNTKGLTGPNKTSFKPGQKPPNTQPIGTTIMREDGYIYVKVKETKPARFGWKALHVINWEKENGAVPPGHKLLFLDGNHFNCDPSNLMLITSAQMATINKLKLTRKDADLTRVGVTIASIISKTHQVEKKRYKHIEVAL